MLKNRRYFCFITLTLLLLTAALQSCLSRDYQTPDELSDTSATQRGPKGQALRCATVLPQFGPIVQKALVQAIRMADYVDSIEKKSHALTGRESPEVLGLLPGTLHPLRLVELAKNNAQSRKAILLAKRTRQMVRNMLRSPSAPIHPVLFFSTVKDFESSTSMRFAIRKGNMLDYFKTSNCTSGECFGLMQVDVRLERDWDDGALCQQSVGINLWGSYPGAADMCSALFWWTIANASQKCRPLSAGAGNPCLDDAYTWTLTEVNRGRRAYVQQAQWGENSWKEMYGYYKQCIVDKQEFSTYLDAFQRATQPALRH